VKSIKCSSCGTTALSEKSQMEGVCRKCNKSQAKATKKAARDVVQKAVNLAIEDGTLKRQPCETCGSNDGGPGPRTTAHHDDYSKPLDVRWMCASCHTKMHHQRRRAKAEAERIQS
jgi:hypothetical protein